MYELVPVILGFVLGAVIWRATASTTRAALSALAILVSALSATVLSGEAEESWVYLLLDLAEAMAGFGAAVLLMRTLARRARARSPLPTAHAVGGRRATILR